MMARCILTHPAANRPDSRARDIKSVALFSGLIATGHVGGRGPSEEVIGRRPPRPPGGTPPRYRPRAEATPTDWLCSRFAPDPSGGRGPPGPHRRGGGGG